MNIKILIERRRLIIQAGGWSLIDLDLLTRLSVTAVRPVQDIPGHDPHGTLAAQVEQADEPAPGFGFAGSSSHIVARHVPDVRKE